MHVPMLNATVHILCVRAHAHTHVCVCACVWHCVNKWIAKHAHQMQEVRTSLALLSYLYLLDCTCAQPLDQSTPIRSDLLPFAFSSYRDVFSLGRFFVARLFL